MEMQEVKERKRKTPAQDAQEPAAGDSEDVTDPTVPALGGARKAKGGKSGGTWLGYIMDRLWSLVFFTVASLGLYEMHFVQEVLYAPEANRRFVHLGIFCCTLVVLFGCYIEIYRSMLLHEKVRYENAKSSTHGMLASIIATGVWYVRALGRRERYQHLFPWMRPNVLCKLTQCCLLGTAYRSECGLFGTGSRCRSYSCGFGG